MPSIRVAVDQGGSGFRIARIASDGTLTTTAHPGFTPGEDSFSTYAVKQLLQDIDPTQKIDKLVLASAAQPASDAEREALKDALFATFNLTELWLCSDAISASQAAIRGDGVVIIMGTGIAALAVGNSRTTVHELSGDGYLIGDEGGAYWIGRLGLNSALREKDGRGGSAALLKRACEFFDTDPDYLADRVHNFPRPVHSIATFAKEVIEIAEAGDEVAISIVDKAVDELMQVALAAKRLCGGNEDFEVVIGGGAFPRGGILHTKVLELAKVTKLYISESSATPLDGVLELLDLPIPGVFAPVIHTYLKSPH